MLPYTTQKHHCASTLVIGMLILLGSAESFAKPMQGRHHIKRQFQQLDVDGNKALSQSEYREPLTVLFRLVDADHNGVLTATEVQDIPAVMRAAQRETLIKRHDEDGNGALSAAEFRQLQKGHKRGKPSMHRRYALHHIVLAHHRRDNARRSSSEQMFGKLDIDGNAELSRSELRLARSKAGQHIFMILDTNSDMQVTESEFLSLHQQAFSSLDRNGDDELSVAELKKLKRGNRRHR